MDLQSGQLSALHEMGIAVWQRRPDKIAESVPTEQTANSEPLNEQLSHCNWIVLLDHQAQNEHQQRLLQAMLSAIGLNQQQVAIVTGEQLAQLNDLPAEGKILLVFGSDASQLVLSDTSSFDDCHGKTHQTLPSKLTTIVSFGLAELLSSPEKKALAWQDLQLAKSTYQQLGQAH